MHPNFVLFCPTLPLSSMTFSAAFSDSANAAKASLSKKNGRFLGETYRAATIISNFCSQFLLFNLKKVPQASAKAWLRLCFSCVSSSNCFCKSRSVTCAERKTPKNPRGITSSYAVQSKYEKIINPNYG